MPGVVLMHDDLALVQIFGSSLQWVQAVTGLLVCLGAQLQHKHMTACDGEDLLWGWKQYLVHSML